MDWDDLRIFLAVSRSGGLPDAARKLGVSQSTALRRLRQLETALGATLFVRSRKGHVLTRDGERLLPLAHDIEAMAVHVTAVIGSPRDKAQGRVRVATTEFGADYVMLPALQLLRERAPQIQMEIDTSPQLLDLSQQEDMIALRFARPERGHHRIQKLGDVPYGLYAHRQLLAACGIDPAQPDLKRIPHLAWTQQFAGITIVRWLDQVMRGSPRAAALSSMRAHLTAVQSGIGASHLPELLCRDDSNLVRINCPQPGVTLEAWLVIPLVHRTVVRVAVVAKIIREAFTQLQSTPPPAQSVPHTQRAASHRLP
jgi:DNA-binding transcriptional LysR family regulator